ncbi:MAG: hypothetical protein EB015_22725, partial [Methylocystaceae bacterium]|nr:hypothetical protein [Methylocystaceae bacterium]
IKRRVDTSSIHHRSDAGAVLPSSLIGVLPDDGKGVVIRDVHLRAGIVDRDWVGRKDNRALAGLLRFVIARLAYQIAKVLDARPPPIKLPAQINVIVPNAASITDAKSLRIRCASFCPASL